MLSQMSSFCHDSDVPPGKYGKLISPLPYLSNLMADDSFLFPITTFEGK